jgi:RHS repeat-associated protein
MVGSAESWAQTFGYDRYGNRTAFAQNVHGQQLPTNPVTLPQIDASTNRFQSGQGYAYDPDGNLISDPQGRRFTFNGDNKQIEVRDTQDQVLGEYRYDGCGKRIKKVTATETTVFVYDGFGKLVAEMSTAAATPNPTVNYTATDPLGSPRVLTNSRGQIVSRRDFMPFGEELAPDPVYRTANLKYGVADNVRKKFTGYERDDETALDFAEARYYNHTHGRFTAVDPLLASGKSANPQTFNRYVYSLNRPLVLTDPDGKQCGRDVEDAGLEEEPSVEKVKTAIISEKTENELTAKIAKSLNAAHFEEQRIRRTAPVQRDTAVRSAAVKDIAESLDPTVSVSASLTGPSGGVTINLVSPARPIESYVLSEITVQGQIAEHRIRTETTLNNILADANVDYQIAGADKMEITRSLVNSAVRAVGIHKNAVSSTPNKDKKDE